MLHDISHDRVKLLEIQEAVTRILIDQHQKSSLPPDLDVGAGSTDDVHMYMIHLLSGRIPLNDTMTHKEQRSGRPASTDYGGTMSMDVALKGITSWKFDPFMVDMTTRHRPLSTTAFWILKNDACIDDLDLDEVKLASFLSRIESGYVDNPYHNRIHASDVLQKVYMTINFGEWGGQAWATEERFAIYFAAIIHDYRHPGFTNWFLVRTRDPIALSHNDTSVLENYHVSEAFKLLQMPENNFVRKFSLQRYILWRRRVINLVLSTDMTKHFDVMTNWDNSFRPMGIMPPSYSDDESRLNTLKVVLKSADIGHCCVSTKLHRRWASLLQEEYFVQGDRETEQGLDPSPLMDRSKPGLFSSQLEFFDIIAIPLYSNLCAAFPGTTNFLSACRRNRAEWAEEFNISSNDQTSVHKAPKPAWMMPTDRIERVVNDMYAAVIQDDNLKACLESIDLSFVLRQLLSFLNCVVERNMAIDLQQIQNIHLSLSNKPGVKEYDCLMTCLATAMSANGFSKVDIDVALLRLNPIRSLLKSPARMSLTTERAGSLQRGLQLT